MRRRPAVRPGEAHGDGSGRRRAACPGAVGAGGCPAASSAAPTTKIARAPAPSQANREEARTAPGGGRANAASTWSAVTANARPTDADSSAARSRSRLTPMPSAATSSRRARPTGIPSASASSSSGMPASRWPAAMARCTGKRRVRVGGVASPGASISRIWPWASSARRRTAPTSGAQRGSSGLARRTSAIPAAAASSEALRFWRTR